MYIIFFAPHLVFRVYYLFCTEELLLAVLEGPSGISGIEAGSSAYKAQVIILEVHLPSKKGQKDRLVRKARISVP